jgi:FMN phosphatase YigB (HAD superfamily)
VIKAVLFDLDDTLLDINLTAFVARYATGKARILAEASGLPLPTVAARLAQSYLRVNDQTRTDQFTNERLLDDTFFSLTSIPMDDQAIADAIDYYERECLEPLRGGIVMAMPRPGARETVEKAMSMGLTVALATNPTLTLAVDHVRMRWAGVDDLGFALVSHIGNSTRTKPCARYYQEFAAQLGLTPQECLMVGNDAARDFPRPDIGMSTAYVGHGWPRRAVWRGSIGELGRRLPEIVDLLNSRADLRADMSKEPK